MKFTELITKTYLDVNHWVHRANVFDTNKLIVIQEKQRSPSSKTNWTGYTRMSIQDYVLFNLVII